MDEESKVFADGVDESQSDLVEGTHVGLLNVETFEDRVQLERHRRHHDHQHPRIDLSAEEYTPEELARMLGTSVDVILHAARHGELKAQKLGHRITCIQHADVVEWLRSREQGI